MAYFEKVVLLLSNLWDSFLEFLEYPQKGKEDIAKSLGEVIEYFGLDPFHTATVIVNLIAISYWKDIRNWDKQSIPEKMLIATTMFGAAFFSLLSLLRITGIVDFGSLETPDTHTPQNGTTS